MKRILVLMLTVLTALEGLSQTSDTTCIHNEHLKTALKLIEQGKIDRADLELTRERESQLQGIVKGKDTVINILTSRVSNYEKQTINYERQLKAQKKKSTLLIMGAALLTGLFIIK
jgi:3-deoxy-D-arabino-heptulosonate 7-phosphate (DAHP) synthase